jgi:type II secretion system protein G
MRRGFTLIELLIVLFLVALLASLVAPAVTGGVQRAREATMREDLRVLRKAIDDYYGDTGNYPAELKVLVERRYLRSVPVDPVTERADTWTFDMEETKGKNDTKTNGIRDVHSGADGAARDGTSFKDW